MNQVSNIPLINRAVSHGERVAIIDEGGSHSYRELLTRSLGITAQLLGAVSDLREARVAFITPPGIDFVAAQWGIWQAGGIAVPLCLSHPLSEIEYVINNAGIKTIIAHPAYEKKIAPLIERHNIELISPDRDTALNTVSLPLVDEQRRAMILYTSGTTSNPKGVVTTHRNICAQITSLIEAWGWSENDHILHLLPLHHIHGVINALCCALWMGARCEMLPRFDAEETWQRFISSEFTLFMAVPTIYVKLIAVWEAAGNKDKERMTAACKKLRLMVSGSAALPVTIFEKWQVISGHALLERYGMTEIGMALSNPLCGERRPGFVGVPLPGVELQLIEESGEVITDELKEGEIRIKGDTVFLEYWEDKEATLNAFQAEWFCTGDIAIRKNDCYRILGRSSTDIIKTGGYKVSALEIEEVLRAHPVITECAVVGISDEEWGERVCSALVIKKDCVLTLEDLRSWASEHLAKYKIPSRLKLVPSLPRNVMGKVTKPKVKELF